MSDDDRNAEVLLFASKDETPLTLCRQQRRLCKPVCPACATLLGKGEVP